MSEICTVWTNDSQEALYLSCSDIDDFEVVPLMDALEGRQNLLDTLCLRIQVSLRLNHGIKTPIFCCSCEIGIPLDRMHCR